MADNVTANGLCRVTKEDIRLCHDLIGHLHAQVAGIGQLEQGVHVLVELLLALGKRSPSDEFSAEMGSEGINHY